MGKNRCVVVPLLRFVADRFIPSTNFSFSLTKLKEKIAPIQFQLCISGEISASGHFCSVCALNSVFRRIYQAELDPHKDSRAVNYTDANELILHIDQLSSTFVADTQQDPVEFLTFLLNHLTDCLSSNQSHHDAKQDTPIQSMFGMNIRRVSRCHLCGSASIVSYWESILMISIEKHRDVIKALDEFFREEALVGESLYECSSCNKKTPGATKFSVDNALPIVFINLKKFVYDQMKKSIEKIQNFVSYPMWLDLTRFSSNTCEDPLDRCDDIPTNSLYKLNAVVVHRGDSPLNGHVFTYMNAPDGLWYMADDERILEVDLNDVLNEKDAYLLCYIKTSPDLAGPTSDASMNLRVDSSAVATSTPIQPRIEQKQTFDDTTDLVISLEFQ